MADDYNGGTGGEGSEKLIGDPSPTADSKAGGKKEIDWGRFGLSEESHAKNYSDNTLTGYGGESGYQQGESGQKIQELFDEQQAGQSSHSQTPWWKANFFVREPVLFGTWDGVFTSCMINIFGVVIFLRTGWMVGNAGVGLSVLIILMTVTVALISSLAAIGVCERCKMESGGIYFLLSHVLGARMGATLGILYSFGQTVACALYCTGFGESVAEMFHWTNPWAVRGVGIAVILLLLAINIAGVKWVIKMQLLLLAVLGVATLDFLVGTVAHTDKDDGFMGYNRTVFKNNSAADYLPGENFFTVFGVFFPTATGVMAGINMSGDLRDARKSIPEGTLSALGVTTVLYLLFAILLGATCDRWYLQNDYMIAETVSLTGFLWLLGLYISSLSSCLGGLYGAPRILQCIANENVIPIIRFLGHGKGPNKEPVIAQLLVCFIAILFIFIGQVNYLGPIVTMPFLLSYAGIDYAYFSLAMSFDRVGGDPSRKEKDSLLSHVIDKNREDGGMSYGALVNEPDERRDSLDEFKKDIEKAEKAFGVSPAARKEGDNEKNASLENGGSQYGGVVGVSDKESLISNQDEKEMKGPFSHEITRMPPSWYSRFCNRWVSLIGAVVSVAIMFAIQWGYALANVCVYLIVYIYIGQANPGVKPGIADFQFFRWIKSLCQRLFRATPPPAQMVLTPIVDNLGMRETSINQDNEDFADRHRFHHSSVVNGNSFVEDQPLSAIHAPDSESEEEIFTGGDVNHSERNNRKEKGLVNGEIEPLLQDRGVTQVPDI